ncbi:hypothetical protein Bca52824_051690 [Brassica carinata]|uniref:Uncharacterized protein n=1 Tax=Brassica carinata TaxID=52824 RepID=A0A8X7UHZ6_BRACI|nr:hypothetical protein Bca52824_051690 [Brassica carinata]
MIRITTDFTIGLGAMIQGTKYSQHTKQNLRPCAAGILVRIRDSEKVFLWWENHRRGSSEAEYDTLPGSVSSPANYEADGFHYRQPWVIGVQEQIESLTKRLEEAEEVMKFVPSLKNQIETLEAKGLTRQIDRLTAEVYNLTVQVADLEKLCFE